MLIDLPIENLSSSELIVLSKTLETLIVPDGLNPISWDITEDLVSSDVIFVSDENNSSIDISNSVDSIISSFISSINNK
jgi:hypothetical protein